jgi:hypothetical protein
MKGVEMTRKNQKSPKSVCFGIKKQIESLSFEGIGGLLFLTGCVSIINIFCLFACNYRSLVQNIVWFFNKK